MGAGLEVVDLECQAVEKKKVNRKTQVQKPNLGHPPRQFDCARGEAYLLGLRSPSAYLWLMAYTLASRRASVSPSVSTTA